jgi:hypothetical protein
LWPESWAGRHRRRISEVTVGDAAAKILAAIVVNASWKGGSG